MKYLRYLWYILRHKWFVFIETCRLGIPWRGITHDSSKLLPDEFFPYAEYFYGGYKRGEIPDAVQCAFNWAWLKHQHRNPHHWQHFILHSDDGGLLYMRMHDADRKEMLADWKGAGKAITGKDNTAEWYKKNRNNILLHPETMLWICRMLKVNPLDKTFAIIMPDIAKDSIPLSSSPLLVNPMGIPPSPHLEPERIDMI